MLIYDWMKANVISVDCNSNLLQCRKIFKENKVSILPVMDAGKVIGVVSATDISAFAPQCSTGLEILEALDVLSEKTVRAVMSAPAITINRKSTVEQAAQLMIEKHVSCLPVVNDQHALVGILTEWDIFKAMASISASAMPNTVAIVFTLENKRGTLRAILDLLKDFDVRIDSILSLITAQGKRQVQINFWSDDKAAEAEALEKLKNHGGLRYWAYKGEVHLHEAEGQLK